MPSTVEEVNKIGEDYARAAIPAGTVAIYNRHQAHHFFKIVHCICTKAAGHARDTTFGNLEVAQKLVSISGCQFGHT